MKSKDMPYQFSLALHTAEKASHIIENRKKIEKYFKRSKNLHFIVANQIHSANIKVITKENTKGWNSIDDAIEECDALITNQYNIILTILTADCVPILLFDPIQQIVAAIHAGWKGTELEITLKTIEKMSMVFGSKPEDIIAGIAPSIGRCCYEVGDDVAKYFKHITNAFTQKENKTMLDLPYINKVQLLKAGVKEKHIEMSNICTACEVARFFSYRREQGCSGRFMSMIGLKD
jgi:YfiH family protein